MFKRLMFCSVQCIAYYWFVIFALTIVVSVLRYTHFGYPFDIFKLLLHNER